ncbi:MAG TPA: enoyl-CoA hydratase/isomerase family protein [Methylomirabilota bacterium]|nr:enoyl-CoA hydratase/isomerase family protein [Methylomirabilota bacterium]
MSFSAVLYEKEGPLAIVALNRPRVLNAYNVEMRDDLYQILLAVRDDPEVRVMILRGEGPAFSTGGDVSEFGSAPSPVGAREVRWRRDVWGTLLRLPQPTIAVVHGYAVGGGMEMALLCDLCIAADDAIFFLPESGLGMIPGVAGTQTAPRAIGLGRALDMVLTGKQVNAKEALRIGLVNRVTARETLLTEAKTLAYTLAEHDPRIVALAKRAIRSGSDLSLSEGLELERRLFSLI